METKGWMAALGRTARIPLVIGVVAIVVLTGAALWWVFGSREQLLFGNLREADAAEIVASLNGWKVPYTITDDGHAITVPTDSVYDVRMRLVSAGVPKGGHVGFELFNDADFGVTEFAQRVNYQRALQGELERTISSLPGVETARVHLTIRRPGLFVGETESSKASVAVTLTPGQRLARPQVNGIRSLVAASVEGLEIGEVSVLDSTGALLAGAAGPGGALDDRDDEEARLEARVQARVSELLARVVEDGQFHVAVDAKLNFDTVRQVTERPLAQGSDEAVLVRKRVNSVGAPDADGHNQSQEDAEYVHGTSREEVSRTPGRVERLSVAVVLPASLDDDEVEHIRALVAASAGIEQARGDQLEVTRLNWHEETAKAPEPVGPQSVRPLPPSAVAPLLPGGLWKLAVVAALGLVAGVVAMAATVRRPRRLSPAERQAVAVKLRGWLAEGQLPS